MNKIFFITSALLIAGCAKSGSAVVAPTPAPVVPSPCLKQVDADALNVQLAGDQAQVTVLVTQITSAQQSIDDNQNWIATHPNPSGNSLLAHQNNILAAQAALLTATTSKATLDSEISSIQTQLLVAICK